MSLPGAVLPWVDRQFNDADGVPLAGGSVEFLETGTATPKNTYSDAARTTPNANPVVLDAAGRATIFLEPEGYDLVIRDSAGTTIYTWTNVEDVGLTFLESLGNTFADGAKDVASGYSVLPTDQLVTIDATETTNPAVIQLPAAATRTVDSNGNGLPVWVKNFAAVPAAVTPDGAETIDGATGAYTLAAAAGALAPSMCLVSDGVSGWYILSGIGLG